MNFIPCMMSDDNVLLVVDQCVTFKGSNGNTYFGRITEFQPKNNLAFVAVNYSGDKGLNDIVFVKGKGLVEYPLKKPCGIFININRLSPLESGAVLLKEWAENPFRALYIEKYLAPIDGIDEDNGFIGVVPDKIRAAAMMYDEEFGEFVAWVKGMCAAPDDESEVSWSLQTFLDAYIPPYAEDEDEGETNAEPTEEEQYDRDVAVKLIDFVNTSKQLFLETHTEEDVMKLSVHLHKILNHVYEVARASVLVTEAACETVAMFNDEGEE